MARPKISQEIREKARLMLYQDYTLKEISEELGISERSVSKIKKEMPPKEQVAPLNISNNNYITKQEKKYIEKIEKELQLFVDETEGWVYHLTKEQLKNKQSGMWWSAIAYPESMPVDMVDRLKALGCQIAISPLHDKDRWEHNSPPQIDEETGEILVPEGYFYKVGDKKKSHYHIIIKLDTRIYFKEANDLIRRCTNGPYIQKCISIKGSYEYFMHLNHPNRYQYEKNEIQEFNGFVVEANAYERKVLLTELVEYISCEEIDTWNKLVKHYSLDYEMINIISKNSYLLKGMIDENWRHHNPNYAKRVKVVENEKE